MLISVYTLGCKVNECEGRSLMEELSLLGYETVSEIVPGADYYILNTCSVTAEADRKCRQTLGKMTAASPNAKILVCGCSTQADQSFYLKHENVIYITGSGNKKSIVDVIQNGAKEVNGVTEVPACYEYLEIPKHSASRDYVKIQDGCNNFCSYCLIPYVRGRERSRSIEDILKEFEAASLRTKEIVLTGINLSSFGKDNGSSLSELCTLLKRFDVRKRMGSLECGVVDERLLLAMKESGFCDHFHLSLQSGSASVLKTMNRHYTPKEYLSKVKLIRSYFPSAGITTDVITGFPGETEENFRETCDFVKEAAFSDIHIFPYSERKGTRAARMEQTDKALRKERALRLGKIRDNLKTEFLLAQTGKEESVFFETDAGGMAEGYSSNYIRVYSPSAVKGEIKTLKAVKPYKKGLLCE